MPRYVAFLRGVSPMNANMWKLKRCFESAGYTGIKTVLASGNVVFDSRHPLIEKTFGKDVTTRSWDTVRKCAKA